MARPSRIVQLHLEQLVLGCREQGLTQPETVVRVNKELDARRAGGEPVGGPITRKAIVRYLASLDEATLPALHQPQVVQENAALSLRFGEQFVNLNAKIGAWLVEAEEARRMVAVAGVGIEDAGPDWDARTKVAKALQQNLDSYADLMERIYNAEQIKAFHEEAIRAIGEESPDCARRIQKRLMDRQSLRMAAITGATPGSAW